MSVGWYLEAMHVVCNVVGFEGACPQGTCQGEVKILRREQTEDLVTYVRIYRAERISSHVRLTQH